MATSKDVTSNKKDLSLTSVSNGDDIIMMTSSTQNKSKKANYSNPVKGNTPEGKTTAVVSVMRGNLKHGYHHHHSNSTTKETSVGPVRQWI